MKPLAIVLLIALWTPVQAQTAEHLGHSDMVAPSHPMLLDGYGSGGFQITTNSAQAQAFFNNGMQLGHAFAHPAAVKAMQEAERLDPTCAMCFWGEAWAAGPTINFGKDPNELKALSILAAKAQGLARSHGTATERALTDALVARYDNGEEHDLAFAKAMERIARSNPANDDLATLAADAWMISQPDGDPGKTMVRHAVTLLETVLARNPSYTPAIHFYIHAMELVGEPAKAERFADALPVLAPKASHLLHMPSHVYYWVGRYQDAANLNRRAVEVGIAQAKAMSAPPPDGVWGLPYHGHNVLYGLGGALMAGDKDTALWLGRPLVERSAGRTAASPVSQALAGSGYVAMGLYADPSEMLSVPAPKLPYLQGMWHYARGEAYARGGDVNRVRVEAEAIAIPPGKTEAKSDAGAVDTLTIARDVLEGRAAMLERRFSDAAVRFEAAATIEESKHYMEMMDPPLWWYPVRRDVAEARLADGDIAGARKEVLASLRLRRGDPAALRLLAEIEHASGEP